MSQSRNLKYRRERDHVRRVCAVVTLLAATLAVAGAESDTVATAPDGDRDESADGLLNDTESANNAETRLDAGVYYLLFGRRQRDHEVLEPGEPDQPCDCDDTDAGDTTEEPSSARYSVTFTARWTAADHGQVPGGAHFTTLAGAAVNADADLWTPGNWQAPASNV